MADASPFLVATLNEQILPEISDNILKRCPLLEYARRKKAFKFKKGGQNIDFRVRYQKSGNVGSTSDWLNRTARTTANFKELSTPWRQYDGNLYMSKFQNKRNVNASAVAKMFVQETEQLKDLYQSFQERICNHAYGDSTTIDSDDLDTPMDGLKTIISSTNTYLGLDRTVAANAWWQAQTGTVVNFSMDDDGNGVTNGVEAMKTLFNLCSVGKPSATQISDSLATAREMPHMTITTRSIYESYENSLMGQYRYVDDTADVAKTLAFESRPIEWDTFAPSGKLFMINFDHYFIWTTEDDASLLSVYGEEEQGTKKIVTIGTQLQAFTDKASAEGVLAVS